MVKFNNHGYCKFIKLLINANYDFISYTQTKDSKKFCLLRHDIDASVSYAYEMAKIESNLGIKSTYFFMTSSSMYNPFNEINSIYIKKIIAMGFDIGLHYNQVDFGSKIIEDINVQTKMLENFFNIKISTVSFHQPNIDIIQNNIKINLINTYDKTDMTGIHYISDSNMNFRDNNPFEIIKNSQKQKLQILIHPIWWLSEGNNTIEKWDFCINKNTLEIKKYLHKTEDAYSYE